jgi:PAS domain S-box-containing protein
MSAQSSLKRRQQLVKRLRRERDEAVELEAASAEVLKIISASPRDMKPVFEAMLVNALRICDARFGHILLYDGERFHAAHLHDVPPSYRAFWDEHGPIRPHPKSGLGQLVRTKQVVHIPDLKAESAYTVRREPLRVATVEQAGLRSFLGVPMLKESKLVGTIIIFRPEVRPFTSNQIQLVKNFAAQAVIAIENARLFERVRAKTRDLEESLQQQTATSEVLQVISSSPGDLTPVFDKMLQNATRVCGAEFGSMVLIEDDSVRQAALYNAPAALAAARANRIFRPHPQGPMATAIRTKQAVHVADVRATAPYLERIPYSVELAELGGARTLVTVPMLRENEVIGAITIYRQEIRPFDDKQIELLSNFAKQAVIAIENTRLLRELRQRTTDLSESLQQQTATSEVLQVISSSMGDVEPVFEKMLENATRVCGAEFGVMGLLEEGFYRRVALYNVPPAFFAVAQKEFRVDPDGPIGTVRRTGQVFKIDDFSQSERYLSGRDRAAAAMVDVAGVRTLVIVPMLRDTKPIGVISIYRQEVRPFGDKQIELLKSFANQAVIAIENARLLKELRQRTDDLSESLQQQTATADVLKVIASSPTDVKPVLKAIVESACELCEANDAVVALKDGDDLVFQAQHGSIPVAWTRRTIDRGWIAGRAATDCTPVHIHDVRAPEGDEFPGSRELARRDSTRTVLAVPLLREGESIGAIVLRRTEVQAFSDKQIALLRTFADQAVIAIQNVRLFDEVQARTRDLAESLRQQTTTADVLKVITRSTFNLQAVLDTLVESATQLCEAQDALIFLPSGNVFRAAARYGYSPEYHQFMDSNPVSIDRGSVVGRAAIDKQIVHITDVLVDPDYTRHDAQRIAGYRTALGVPLLREGDVIGVIFLTRIRPQPFSRKQIELVTTFADQAVIAIENTRLLSEQREALEQQTATAEVLQVINASPGNLAPVFEAILEKAHGLCAVTHGSLQLYDGNEFRAVAVHGLSEAFAERLRQGYVPGKKHQSQRLIEGERFVQTPDLAELDDPIAHAAYEHSGIRTALFIPLRKDASLIGQIVAARREVRPFSKKEIALLENFAAQAVVAMESARLFGELRDRTADLARSVDELTATGDVLKIISRSSVDLETVLDTLVETVARLCRADQAIMFRRLDERYRVVASHGLRDEAMDFLLAHPLVPDRGTLSGRVELERQPVHVADVLQDPEYTYLEGQKVQGYRTMLGIPLLREEALIGIFVVNRTRVEPFTKQEIELATTFADQAVIAIENARLFEELRERQAELRVTFDSMGDGVVMFGADTRLVAWNRNFQEILDLPDDFLTQRPSYSDYFRYLAQRGEYSADLEAALSRTLDDTSRELRFERRRPDGRVIEVRRNPVPGGGFVLIYADITERKQAEEAIRAARDAAEAALRELQKTQASLVHAQKMAALGQLTAGIAHEIRNPLNFVNNFAGLSVELLEELKEAALDVIGALGPANAARFSRQSGC